MTLGKEAEYAWIKLSKWLPSRSSENDWWFKTTGPQLVRLLSEAGYPLSQQYEALLFHYQAVVPHLGTKLCPSKPPWKSFMTDDFTPIEYSWKWGMGSNPPEIRYAIEALGPLTGTQMDPLNQIPTCELLHMLGSALPNLDLTWFNHFRTSLFGTGTLTASGTEQGKSSILLAFEMVRGGVSVKAYFVPVERPGMSIADQIFAATMAAGCSSIDAINEMEAYLSQDPKGLSLKPFMLGIDCVKPSESRLKVYVRSPRTSFKSVSDVMTLGGRRKEPMDHLSEEQFHQLWKLTLGLPDDFPPCKELPPPSHPTSGICFYFDVAAKSAVPDVKAYIPTNHYGTSDAAVAKGLVHFLEKQERAHYAQGYLRTVESLATAAGLDAGTGLQTCIACAYQEGELSMTCYLSPQLYHPTRWT